MTDQVGNSDQGGEAPYFAHLLDDHVHLADGGLVQLAHELDDALVIADVDGTIAFWNDAATRLFGWSTDEAVGRSLDLIIPERLRDRHWAGYRQVMSSGQTRHGGRLLEVPALHRHGRQLSIAFTVTLLSHPDDARPYAIAAVVRDDTQRWRERRELQQRVAELESAISSRTSGVQRL